MNGQSTMRSRDRSSDDLDGNAPDRSEVVLDLRDQRSELPTK
jgi:hypothetical protein